MHGSGATAVRGGDALHVLRDENARLVQQLSELELEFARLKAQHQALDGSVQSRADEASAAMAEAQETQRQARSQTTEAQLRVEQLELDLGRERRLAAEAAAAASREALEAEAKHTAEVDVLRRECRTRDRDMLSLRRELAKSETRIRELEAGPRVPPSVVEALKANVDAAETRAEDLQARCRRLEESEAELQREVASLQGAQVVCKARRERGESSRVLSTLRGDDLARSLPPAISSADSVGADFSSLSPYRHRYNGDAHGRSPQSMPLYGPDDGRGKQHVTMVACLQNQIDVLRKENLKLRMERCVGGPPPPPLASLQGATHNDTTMHMPAAPRAQPRAPSSRFQMDDDDPVQMVRDLRKKLFGERGKPRAESPQRNPALEAIVPWAQNRERPRRARTPDAHSKGSSGLHAGLVVTDSR
mmetsp:Transcript_6644/g.11592  ORF Transcript_6644/g.11592 Transcript_6644/m.11592 type:complete len:420 (+) Transcript_6644:62-1321(+)